MLKENETPASPDENAFEDLAARVSDLMAVPEEASEDEDNAAAIAEDDASDLQEICSIIGQLTFTEAPDIIIQATEMPDSVLLVASGSPAAADAISKALLGSGFECDTFNTQVLCAKGKARKKRKAAKKAKKESAAEKRKAAEDDLQKKAADSLAVLHDARAIKMLQTMFGSYVVGAKDDYRQFIRFLKEVDGLLVEHRKSIGKSGERTLTAVQAERDDAERERLAKGASGKPAKKNDDDKDEDNTDAIA